jgi:hypothetical protein
MGEKVEIGNIGGVTMEKEGMQGLTPSRNGTFTH